MNIQPVSNQQSFNGSIQFINPVNAKGVTEKLSETLAPKIREFLPEMSAMVRKKPYDLFISRPKDLSEFYQVDANVKFENVLGTDVAKKGLSSMVYIKRLERFPSAAAEAIRSFEELPGYKELVKPEGFFKSVWKALRGIKD